MGRAGACKDIVASEGPSVCPCVPAAPVCARDTTASGLKIIFLFHDTQLSCRRTITTTHGPAASCCCCRCRLRRRRPYNTRARSSGARACMETAAAAAASQSTDRQFVYHGRVVALSANDEQCRLVVPSQSFGSGDVLCSV